MGPQGASVNKVDASGRIALRDYQLDELEDSVVLTQRFNGQIVMMSPEQWPDMVKQFDAESQLDPDMNDLRRVFIGAAIEVELDDRGRLKIPEALRGAAGLKPGQSRATILSLGTTWEIWEEKQYIEYMEEQREHLKALARQRFGSLRDHAVAGEAVAQ